LGDFHGEANETAVLYPRGSLSAKRVIIVGLGNRTDFNAEALRRAVATGVRQARKLGARHVASALVGVVAGDLTRGQAAQAIVEGALLGLYTYHGQKSSKPDPTVNVFDLMTGSDADTAELEAGVGRGVAFAAGANLTRDLVNLPANICTPAYLAQRAMSVANEYNLSIDVLEEKQMTALKMGALLGVAQGSHERPRFIVMQHNAEKADSLETVVLVGKGVTFDTGGYSLKTRDGMIGMKADMGGGAAVIGAMQIVAALDLPLHVVGLVPASDNNISDKAYRPQDVLTASNGTTIEVISTDAEGRLLLADALVYAKRYNPSAVVDIATLTGSAVVALGHAAAALFSTDDSLRDRLQQAADATGERVWPMPLYPEYHRAIRSDTADVKNSGGRMNGVGTSAAFLQTFVEFPVWAHIDMAGMVQDAENTPTAPPKGATGYGARLLAQFVEMWSQRKEN
jgi:leucyl aminopeptidase